MAHLIDIYTIRDGIRIMSQMQPRKESVVWKCGACLHGNVASATSWECIDIRKKCPSCKRKIDFYILGR